MNITIVRGALSRPPQSRTLPSGDVLVSYDITVPGTDDRAAESVPVVWFGASPAAQAFEPETEVLAVGRVRRRFFRAGGSTQSRTEVVAEAVVPVRQAKRAARVARAALADADEALSR
jgi:single-strand DNA-binding protein